jgi:hypothetical protein
MNATNQFLVAEMVYLKIEQATDINVTGLILKSNFFMKRILVT